MKDKKRVLKILMIMIIIFAIILAIVLVLGGFKAKQYEEYQNTLEQSACKMAEDENYTEAICEGFESLCKVHFDKLIIREYVDKNLKNPITHDFAANDKNSYINITFKNNQAICNYEEG